MARKPKPTTRSPGSIPLPRWSRWWWCCTSAISAALAEW